jgi:uncharacterized protein YegP (UPF0339 family)
VARNGKFVIKQGRVGMTHFVLLASDGRVVVTSETYASKQSCLKGIGAVKRLAADATVIDDAMTAAPTASKRATGREAPTVTKPDPPGAPVGGIESRTRQDIKLIPRCGSTPLVP